MHAVVVRDQDDRPLAHAIASSSEPPARIVA
jgi:hypothetical protein